VLDENVQIESNSLFQGYLKLKQMDPILIASLRSATRILLWERLKSGKFL